MTALALMLAQTIGTGSTLEDVFFVVFIIVGILWILGWLLAGSYRTRP